MGGVEVQLNALLNKKFWEEIIAYFLLIHGEHRKRKKMEDTQTV
jgi:hypothetical protein